MWLVFCADTSLTSVKKRVDNVINELAVKPQVQYVEAIKITPIIANLAKLSQVINDYDYVLCVSPSCIEVAKLQIKQAIHPKFLVMGKQSYTLLRKYTDNEILYSKTQYGIAGLIDEILPAGEFINHKLLVLNKTGVSSADKLKSLALKIDFLPLYHGQLLQLTYPQFNQLFMESTINVVCVTSSSIVSWLFEECQIRQQVKYVDQLVFLAWHKQIVDKLISYGISTNKIKLTNL